MNFTEKEILRLYTAYRNSAYIVVRACNGMGQEFIAEGKIANITSSDLLNDKQSKSDCGIFYDSIILDYDIQSSNKSLSDCKKFNVKMFNTLDSESEASTNFFIESIELKSSGKTLYRNKDYMQFYKMAIKRMSDYTKFQVKNGITPAINDDFGLKLSKKVGRPVNINGINGILYFVNNLMDDGSINLHLTTSQSFLTMEIVKPRVVKVNNGVIMLNSYKSNTIEDSKENSISDN